MHKMSSTQLNKANNNHAKEKEIEIRIRYTVYRIRLNAGLEF